MFTSSGTPAVYPGPYMGSTYINIRARLFIHTMNVDIFACINFRGFMKMGNFACIKIRVLSIIGTLSYYQSNSLGVHIFADI